MSVVRVRVCVCDGFSGLSPAAAELRYLKKAATLDMYGVDLHHVLVSCLSSNSSSTQNIPNRPCLSVHVCGSISICDGNIYAVRI